MHVVDKIGRVARGLRLVIVIIATASADAWRSILPNTARENGWRWGEEGEGVAPAEAHW
jgi:hypothetical protein